MHGGKCTRRNKYNITPFEELFRDPDGSIRDRFSACVKLLLAFGVKPEATSLYKEVAADKTGHYDVVKEMISAYRAQVAVSHVLAQHQFKVLLLSA